MISLSFILLFTWYVRADRKLPQYLQDGVLAYVAMYLFLFFMMGLEIVAYISFAGSILFGIASLFF